MNPVDTLVLGAGMAGVSVALQLQERNRSVVLVDRQEPGEGTSYGNAGIIEIDGFEPITFPSDFRSLIRYALNREPDVHYHLKTLLRMAPWLNALRRHSQPDAIDRYIDIMKPLILSAGQTHYHLAEAANALDFYRYTGWLKLFRAEGSQSDAEAMCRAADLTESKYSVLSKADMSDLEPHVAHDFHTALFFQQTRSVSSPGGVTKAFANSFVSNGGLFQKGDAASLSQDMTTGLWTVMTDAGPVSAREVVIALGPWSTELVGRFGYRVPLEVKRGYHQHFSAKGNAGLSRPVVDMDNGYVITPMEKGIRLTSGIEFADFESPPTPVQIQRILPRALELFPLDKPVESEPWMGNRPCMPDSMPVLGKAPRHDGLWFSFGHGHWGFSLGPITGKLVAQSMVGETPDCDISALSSARFA